MKQNQNQKRTKNLNKQYLKYPAIATALISSFLLGCATATQNNRAVSNILTKENVLIQKLKEQRSQPEITKAIENSEPLKAAEAHLLMALEELHKANENIQSTFLIQTKKGEATNGN